MRIIAHRGLLEGPDKALENHPLQIQKALDMGFDVEIDIRFDKGRWYLGHDNMDHEIAPSWLKTPNLWIHCKNVSAFYNLKRFRDDGINFFYHDTDLVILTSKGDVWTYFGPPETKDTQAVCVLPEVNYDWDEIGKMVNSGQWLGICTDWSLKARSMLE